MVWWSFRISSGWGVDWIFVEEPSPGCCRISERASCAYIHTTTRSTRSCTRTYIRNTRQSDNCLPLRSRGVSRLHVCSVIPHALLYLPALGVLIKAAAATLSMSSRPAVHDERINLRLVSGYILDYVLMYIRTTNCVHSLYVPYV